VPFGKTARLSLPLARCENNVFSNIFFFFDRMDAQQTKSDIQQMVALGQTEDALALFARLSADAILLQGQFNTGKKQYGIGVIDFTEWSRIQSRINYAIIEALNMVKTPSTAPSTETHLSQGGTSAQTDRSVPSAAEPQGPRVFISYSHKDMHVMRSVKRYLEDNGIHSQVDLTDLSVGAEIQAFVDKALRDNDFVVSIISRDSLESGWVSAELTVAKFLNKTNQNWIPVAIDGAWKDDKFYFTVTENIERKMVAARKQLKKALDAGVSISPMTEEMSRLEALKANIGSTIATLKDLYVVDISGELFEVGMAKVLRKIKPA
jgi:hypothetical protein